jgi:8-oxo-dGTP diphosphatase
VRVAAAILAPGGLVVVTQHKHGSSYALLPGGGVAWGEPLDTALEREVLEEIGLPIAVEQLLLVNDSIAPDGSKHVINLTFSARPLSSTDSLTPHDPAIDAVLVVPLDELASLDLRPPIARHLLHALSHDRLPPCATYLGPLWAPDLDDAQGGRPPDG